MKRVVGLLIATVCLTAVQTARAQVDEEAAKKTAAEMTRLTVIEYLKDREFKLEAKELEATAEAIDPKEHVKVEVLEFTLLPNRVVAKFQVDALLGFEGTLQTDDGPIDIRGEADAGQQLSIKAEFFFLDGSLKINADITELEFEIKIREMRPEDVPGGTERLEKIAQEEFDRQHDDLLREMNKWVDEQNSK